MPRPVEAQGFGREARGSKLAVPKPGLMPHLQEEIWYKNVDPPPSIKLRVTVSAGLHCCYPLCRGSLFATIPAILYFVTPVSLLSFILFVWLLNILQVETPNRSSAFKLNEAVVNSS